MKPGNDPNMLKVTASLVLAGILLFGSSFNDPFHFDDALITKDSNVTNPSRWYHFFNPLHLRQLTFFTFYLNHLSGGDSPSGFHIVNVLLHIVNAWLLYYLLRRFVEPWIAIVAAGIFLVHPIQTEPVLYIYQRSVLLAAIFSLLALLALAERRYLLAVLLFFCGFESKESALGVPLAVVLLAPEAFPGEIWSQRLKRHRSILLVFIAAFAVVALGVMMYRGETTVGIGAVEHTSPISYFFTQTRVIYTYLRLLVFPIPQSLEYQIAAGNPAFQIAGLLVLIGLAWWAFRSARFKVFGLSALAFFILLAPTSSFIPSRDVAFEHRLYLPMMAFSIFAACCLAFLPARSVIAGFILLIAATVTMNRAMVWSSEIALWEDTARKAPDKPRVWFNLGGAYLNQDPDSAMQAFNRALDLQPKFPEALYNLGVIQQGKGNYGAAFSYYERAVGQDPLYWPAWNNLGNVAFTLKDSDRAIEYLERTLSLNPDYWPAQYNLAIVHFTHGRFEKALQRLKTVLDWKPDFREARYLFAVSLDKAGYRVAAGEEWKKLGESEGLQSNAPVMLPAPSRP